MYPFLLGRRAFSPLYVQLTKDKSYVEEAFQAQAVRDAHHRKWLRGCLFRPHGHGQQTAHAGPPADQRLRPQFRRPNLPARDQIAERREGRETLPRQNDELAASQRIQLHCRRLNFPSGSTPQHPASNSGVVFI